MYFWSLHFGSIRILVSKLISFLLSPPFLKNRFYFSLCRHPSNKTLLCDKRSALIANMVLTWHWHDIKILLKKIIWLFQYHVSILIFYFHIIIIIIIIIFGLKSIIIIIFTFIIFFCKNITSCSSCSSQIQEINPATNLISSKPKSKSSNQI